MFDRLISLIGEDKFNLIKTKKVLVLGCGGVGSYVIEGLARSGIENITIVDCDIVDITNLNRQLIALHSTIGKRKVDVMKERILDINPDANVLVLYKRVEQNKIEELKLEEYDYVVDAIDDVKVKVELCKYALKRDVKLIVSTGTAKKMHPEKLEITTLDKTSGDPLAKKMRYLLREYDTKKIKVLTSSEVPIVKGNTLGSSAFVPSSAGLLIASHIILDIATN